MTNPFEITDKDYVVLVNDEGQHSVWPDFLAVPAGWMVSYGPAPRQACLDHIDVTWVDMRPRGLGAQRAAAAVDVRA